ncbi:MAG: NAD(+) synthase [Austwickia sp.]|nr:NAD(+) synthase [Actinomycetota bacterium]MCB1254601.1 NAD(+) synthase [Austwickia sp.]MCO5310776.1 NAD(+) synthase [Austwickia sp.]
MSHDAVTARCAWLRDRVHGLPKQGALVQLSGGVDSSVVVHLCARALGPEHVTALYLPDTATGPETRAYVDAAVASAGVRLVERSIAAAIEAQQPMRDVVAILQRYAPDYDPARDAYAVCASPERARRLGALVYDLAIGPRHGAPERIVRLRVEDLRALIAYQNRKQRTRMLFAYAEAEANNLAVVGASNGDELRTGFVVKYGDDAADLLGIGDLTKSGVYELARELGVPEQIIGRPPTTDTYALKQSQDDYYYYALPADVMGRLLELAPVGAAPIADDAPWEDLAAASGWAVAGLRQAAQGLRASLHYQETRSLRYHPGDGPLT